MRQYDDWCRLWSYIVSNMILRSNCREKPGIYRRLLIDELISLVGVVWDLKYSVTYCQILNSLKVTTSESQWVCYVRFRNRLKEVIAILWLYYLIDGRTSLTSINQRPYLSNLSEWYRSSSLVIDSHESLDNSGSSEQSILLSFNLFYYYNSGSTIIKLN